MELASKESFKKRTVKAVTLPNGDTAHLRALSGKERDSYHALVRQDSAGNNSIEGIYCSLLVRCLCTADGMRLFGDGDAAELADTDSVVLGLLFEEACTLNGIGKGEAEPEATK